MAEIEIVDLKMMPDSAVSQYVREYFLSLKANSRLSTNYINFDPWSDSSFLTYDAVTLNGQVVSVGGLQMRKYYPPRVARANSRHYLFPQFRSKSFVRKKIGVTTDGVQFGGALIRHQITLAHKYNLGAVFVSRDKGIRAFRYFMESSVNNYINDSSKRLNVFENFKFNLCNNPLENSCWQYIAVSQIDKSYSLDQFNCLPKKSIES